MRTLQRSFIFAFFLRLCLGVANADVPNVFENGTPADADQVNENFKVQDEQINSLDGRISSLERARDISSCTYQSLSGTWFVPLALDFPFNAGYIILQFGGTGQITGTVYPENAGSFNASGSYTLQADCLIPRLSVSGGGITLDMKAAASVGSTVMVGNGYASDGTQLEFNAVRIK